MHDRSRGAEDILHRLGDLPRRIALVQMILGELDEASRTEEPAPAAAMQKTLDDSPDEIANGEDSCRHVVLFRHLAAGSHRRGTLCIPAGALQLIG